jgi:exonuclease SbcC
MRPLRLELEGFSTFRDRAVLDFDGLDLVAFTGPTGAGKSTLIDAITFALYGSVARYDDTKRVAPVIHQLVNEARVRLDFESGGRVHIATRVVRRRSSKGRDADGATTREARLERVEPDGSTTVLASEVRELKPAVEELLGLDFAQFTRTIVLPQGEFAAFLRDDQASRDKLLQRLLDLGIYERMGSLARSRAKEAGVRLEMLADQRRRLAPPDDDELARLGARQAELERFRDEATARMAELALLDGALDPLRERVVAIDDATRRLEAVEVPEAVDGLDRDLEAARERRDGLEVALTGARAARDEAQAAVDRLPDKGDVVRAQGLVEQLAAARRAVEALETEAGELVERSATLGRRVAEGEAEVADAEARVGAARRAADAAQWTATLEVGHPCPVCRQDVTAIPDHDPAGELDEAEVRLRELAARVKEEARELAEITERARLVAGDAARRRDEIEGLEGARSAAVGPSDPEELAAVLVAIDRAQRAGREAAERVSDLERDRSEAAAAEEELSHRTTRLRSELSALRDSLADQGPPPLASRSLLEDHRALAAWADDRARQLAAERVDLAEEGNRLKRARFDLLEELATAAGALELRTDPADLVTAVGAAIVEASTLRADAERRRDEDRAIGRDMKEREASKVLDEAIGRHLRAGGFGSWLLAEAVDSIVAKATVWLRELSDQRYSLVAGERSFAIIDHNNADEVRDVRTLSGGETFLASLALALALADSIAELAPVDAPQLDSMFLDEGFGTLDPATLDVVATAMEELASAGRMIGVVTHVADLAERMPAQFRVTKGPATSTVELVAR